MEHAPAWLINSLIYLSAAVIAVPLSKAVGLGAIIGYLAAGIAIGPWGAGLVNNVEDILHFAEFGVVLMLFLVGLELEPRRLWSLRRSIFGWGALQVLGCTALLMLVAMACGVGWRLSLVGALGLALSSTAIALQVMGERNLMPTQSGQAAFSILLFQDVAAIPILALLPLLGASSGSNDGLAPMEYAQAAIKIIAVIAGIVLGGRLLLREIMRNPELGYRPVGFIDDDPRKQGARIDRGLSVLGTTEQLGSVLEDVEPDEVLIAIPSAPGTVRARVVTACRERGVPVRTMPTVFELLRTGGAVMRQVRPVEVEDILYKHPAVLFAAVVAKPDTKWGEVPCAFVELKENAQATEADIIAFCRAQMPGFKTPKAVLFGPIPKTSTGKIQKFILRDQVNSAKAIQS